jgi:hypothetical protein
MTDATAEKDDLVERQSDIAIRNLIAREIWRYQECEESYGDFDAVSSSSIGMAELIKQTAIDQAELIRAIILKSPVLIARIHAGAAKEEDDAYEIGKRDGYEDAIQDLDLATGGDGEFKGSTIPGQTVDVPAMKALVLAELTTLRAQLASMRDALTEQEKRWDAVHDMVLKARELVRLDIEPDNRPVGLFQSLQDALYAIRGRAALNASPGSAGQLSDCQRPEGGR